jgi:isopenicillin N synthase-like dioxygenase
MRWCAEHIRPCSVILPCREQRKWGFTISRRRTIAGYVAHGDIKADHDLKGGDMHEAFEAAQDLPADDPDYLKGNKFFGPNSWPDEPSDFRWALGTYFDAQLEFGKKMLRAFALALDLGASDGHVNP